LKKNKVFKILAITFSVIGTLILIYILGILYFFFKKSNIDEEIKKNIFFFDKYTKIIHHLRSNPVYLKKITKSQNLLFDVYNDNNDRIVLFQGDSWFEQTFAYKDQNKELLKNQNFKYINAGISSYSPSLMLLQLKLLESDFKIFPELVIIFLDQTDIYDEVCRYKFIKKYTDNFLTSIPSERRPVARDAFNKRYEIYQAKLDAEFNSKILKAHYSLAYKTVETLEQLVNLAEINFFNKKKKVEVKNCKKKKNYYSFSNDEIKYFEKQLKNYLNYIISKKHIKKILLVTHFHKDYLNRKQNINSNDFYISELVDTVLLKYPKIKHLNFSKIITNEEFELLKKESSWLKDKIHLNESLHTNYFMKKIDDQVYELYNLKK